MIADIRSITLGIKEFYIGMMLDEKIYTHKIQTQIEKDIANKWRLSMRAAVLGNTLYDHKVTHPKDWKQAFKERWFPKWLLKRYPVEYTTHDYRIDELYPHLQIAWPEEKPYIKIYNTKTNWLAEDDN